MRAPVTLCVILLSLLFVEAAEARARRPAKRAVKPKLLFTVDQVETAPALAKWKGPLKAALDKALAAHPLVITDLGLKKPTRGRIAWELRRRRLRHFGVTVKLGSVQHKVLQLGDKKVLLAEAHIALSGKRKERFRKGTFSVQGMGKSTTEISVVLQGEVLASRRAALADAVKQALRGAVGTLTAKKKRRRR